MAFFDKILKREKKEKAPEKKEAALASRSEEKLDVGEKNLVFGFGTGVLKGTHVTEKAAGLANLRQYVFRVNDNANKTEIKRAVAKRYGVSVLRVNTVRLPGKTRRMGRRTGRVPGYTKAVVTLKEGQSIETT